MADNENEVTDEHVARRAYELSQSDEHTTDEENWYRAERELRGEHEPAEPSPEAAPAQTSKKKDSPAAE